MHTDILWKLFEHSRSAKKIHESDVSNKMGHYLIVQFSEWVLFHLIKWISCQSPSMSSEAFMETFVVGKEDLILKNISQEMEQF